MKKAYDSCTRNPLVLTAMTALLTIVTACSSDSSQDGLAAPTNLTATAVSSSRIDISWTGSLTRMSGNGISRSAIYDSGFRVEQSVTSASTGFSIIAETENTSCTCTSLSGATQYWYRVRAFDQEGSSDWSAVTTATTPASILATP
jgi:titin